MNTRTDSHEEDVGRSLKRSVMSDRVSVPSKDYKRQLTKMNMQRYTNEDTQGLLTTKVYSIVPQAQRTIQS